MRIFVSSSFEDLSEHRTAAIRVLRQLGHEVVAMEEMVAGAVAPLAKVIDMVDRSEAYVGLFAWRYGYVPTTGTEAPAKPAANPPKVAGASYGATSITHYEYLRAVERKLPVMAFLLDEQYPWPPRFIDGFDPIRPGGSVNTSNIRALRQVLQQERVVSWFTTPTDLEARVGAAVTMAGLTRQLDLQAATALDPAAGTPGDSSGDGGITWAILGAGDQLGALKIDLVSTWWSTRLYLLAALANHLTQVRRILVVRTAPATSENPIAGETFVGQLSTSSILLTIGPKLAALTKFRELLRDRAVDFSEARLEIVALLDSWKTAFEEDPGSHAKEQAVKVDLTPELLRRWFGDAMLQQPVHIADLQRSSVVDLLRVLDYPNDFVPVLTRHTPIGDTAAVSERVDVMDKRALNARLARSYLVELMDRARIA
jgi:uncharacterized protein DUF4062